MHKNRIDSNDVPPGALISFVQKGLQYLELEANIAAEVRQWQPQPTLCSLMLHGTALRCRTHRRCCSAAQRKSSKSGCP